MDQIPAKFLMDGAEVLALPLGNTKNLSKKLSTFPEECKIAKKVQGLIPKTTVLFPSSTSIKNNGKINSLSN